MKPQVASITDFCGKQMGHDPHAPVSTVGLIVFPNSSVTLFRLAFSVGFTSSTGDLAGMMFAHGLNKKLNP